MPKRRAIKIRLDHILQERLEEDARIIRLGRNGTVASRQRVLAQVLADLESTGDAMRYVNYKGQIAWKATPRLRDYLMDLQLDAEEELDDEGA